MTETSDRFAHFRIQASVALSVSVVRPRSSRRVQEPGQGVVDKGESTLTVQTRWLRLIISRKAWLIMSSSSYLPESIIAKGKNRTSGGQRDAAAGLTEVFDQSAEMRAAL